MCGIAGVVSLAEGLRPPHLETLVDMVGVLHHRGPDEFGCYRDHTAGLGHARLSIIDLTTGQQPLSNEDETLWIVFNGEIFNYVELRAELDALGHRFKTRSDTEVIVHAYEAWGDEAFRRFNGQWAIALWDSVRRKLVLARDPFGVLPLYLCAHGGRLYFASEVKAIFAADHDIPRAFDPFGMAEIFSCWSPLAPRTPFAGVDELEPGCVRTYEIGRPTTTSWAARPNYPSEASPGFQGSLDDAVVAVREALEEATSLRMLRADVPVGSYLSGGLDSSLIAALGLRAKGESFRTFSLRFADAEYDETEHQREVSRFLGSEHYEVLVDRADIARIFPDVIAHTERPILRTAPAPLFLLSRLVHEAGIKVVLTGEGADEMFAGYDLFREGKVRRFWARQPDSTSRPRLLERLYPYLARSPVAQQAVSRKFFGQQLDRAADPGFAHAPRWRSTASLQRMFSPAIRDALNGWDACAALVARLPRELAGWTPLAQDQHLEMVTLLSGYLLSSQGDRMLMAHSVEGRFPFLDPRLAALAQSLPAHFKLRVLDEKHVLKRVAAGLVPESVLRRPKQPYRAPDALSFFGGAVPEWVGEVTSEAAVAAAGVFAPETVTQLMAKCRARGTEGQFSNTDNMAVAGVLSTQLVFNHFIRAPADTAPRQAAHAGGSRRRGSVARRVVRPC